MSKKNSKDTIGNRNRDLPAFSAVPQPTAPPRAPVTLYSYSVFTKDTRCAVKSEQGLLSDIVPFNKLNFEMLSNILDFSTILNKSHCKH